MLNDLSLDKQVYIVTGYTDLRCSIDGLAMIVKAQMQLDPYSTALFLFCGRRVTALKDFSGKATDFCFCISVLITENSNGCIMKQKFYCLHHSKHAGFLKA